MVSPRLVLQGRIRSTYQIKISLMAQPSDNHVVFGSQYVSGVSVNLMVEKGSDEFLLMEGNEEGGAFTVQKYFNISHNRLLMLQNPEKAVVALLVEEGHAKWNAYSWNSEKIFSISKDGARVNVSLSCNDDMDFQIKGSMSDGNCIIYTGDSSTIIAQVRPPETNDKVMVEIYPNVDYAFVVALIVIVDAMKIDEPVVYPPVMAQPNDESPVIVPQYISENPVNLTFKKVGPHEYVVFKDSYEEKVFNIKSSHKIFHKQWMVVGEDGKLVAMLQKKIMTGHSRWYVFHGESEADPKRFFSVCKDHMIQRKTVLNVMLEKGSGAAIDYKVEGSWTNKACTIYKGDYSTDIAEMCALEEDKENFMVKVYPNVDYSFVVALVAVVAAMKSPRKLKVAVAYGVDLTIKFAGGAAVAVGQIVVEGLL